MSAKESGQSADGVLHGGVRSVDGNDGAAASGGYRIAVMASGSGSNFAKLAEAAQSGLLSSASIELLVSDKPSAKVVERAAAFGVDAFTFRPKDYPSREAYETEIVRELERRRIDLVVMAGYMRLITSVLVKPYYGRLINVHPALLPSFPGLHAARQALEHGVKLAGATVHFVDGGMDTGPIIAQRAVEVRDDDTEETLTARIQALEYTLLPETVRKFAEGRVSLDGRKVTIRPPINA